MLTNLLNCAPLTLVLHIQDDQFGIYDIIDKVLNEIPYFSINI